MNLAELLWRGVRMIVLVLSKRPTGYEYTDGCQNVAATEFPHGFPLCCGSVTFSRTTPVGIGCVLDQRSSARARGRQVSKCRSARVTARSSSSARSEEHTSELQSQFPLVCRLL